MRAIVAFLLYLLLAVPAFAQSVPKWHVIVIPDTQLLFQWGHPYTEERRDKWDRMIGYILAQRPRTGVVHVGDMVHGPGADCPTLFDGSHYSAWWRMNHERIWDLFLFNRAHWMRGQPDIQPRLGFVDLMESGIPWLAAQGNHDRCGWEEHGFNEPRFRGAPWQGGLQLDAVNGFRGYPSMKVIVDHDGVRPAGCRPNLPGDADPTPEQLGTIDLIVGGHFYHPDYPSNLEGGFCVRAFPNAGGGQTLALWANYQTRADGGASLVDLKVYWDGSYEAREIRF